jgi:iron(III) transport system ATP-binding protein
VRDWIKNNWRQISTKAWPRQGGGRRLSGSVMPDMKATRPRAAAAFSARLAFEGVTCTFDGSTALNGVSLVIEPGEIVCLLGPSGSGKTTLLRVASGIERPTTGRVLINEVVVAGPSTFVQPERRNIGLMFQDFALFPHLTILDNVAFGLQGLSDDTAYAEALSLLSRVGMAHHATNFPHTLSGGEQQRVALARALVPRPSVVLMDEPFSGLDVQLREQLQTETLKLLQETRATAMIVTHSPDEALRLGDRIAVLRAGRLVQVGKAEELYRNPADLFVARLFSEINEIHYVVTGGAVRTPIGVFSVPDIPEGDTAILCIRRRALRVMDATFDISNADDSAQSSNVARSLFGRVLRTRFLGDVAMLELGVEGFDQPLTTLVAEHAVKRPGTDVTIVIDPADVLIFPAENQPSSVSHR